MTLSFARVEAVCANVVERAFATAFPSALEPVQIARKLVSAFESGTTAPNRYGRLFTVRLHPKDHARLESDLPYLERQWTAMLAGLAERSGTPQRSPVARAVIDRGIGYGTASIAVESQPVGGAPFVRVRRGIPDRSVRLAGTVVIGRDPGCDLALVDPRVSRRHLEIAERDGLRFRDLGSANGTTLNGVRATEGALACGDVLGLGDCELVIDARDDEGDDAP